MQNQVKETIKLTVLLSYSSTKISKPFWVQCLQMRNDLSVTGLVEQALMKLIASTIFFADADQQCYVRPERKNIALLKLFLTFLPILDENTYI